MADSVKIFNEYSFRDLEQRKVWYTPVVSAYDRGRPLYPEALIQRAIEAAHLSPDSTILEVGCGSGIATINFAQLGCAIDAVEPNRDFCRRCSTSSCSISVGSTLSEILRGVASSTTSVWNCTSSKCLALDIIRHQICESITDVTRGWFSRFTLEPDAWAKSWSSSSLESGLSSDSARDRTRVRRSTETSWNCRRLGKTCRGFRIVFASLHRNLPLLTNL